MSYAEPVTVLFDRKVRPDKKDAYEEWYQNLIETSELQTGHISTQVINDGDRYITVQQFDSQESLNAWLESPERSEKLKEMTEFVTEAPQPVSFSGIESWFRLPSKTTAHAKPRRWKQAIITFCVIYTLVLMLSIVVMPYIVDWPVIIRSAVFPLFIVPLMIYVIMPRVTKWLRKWLMK